MKSPNIPQTNFTLHCCTSFLDFLLQKIHYPLTHPYPAHTQQRDHNIQVWSAVKSISHSSNAQLYYNMQSDLEVTKLFQCSTQMSLKFHAQMSDHKTGFITSGPDLSTCSPHNETFIQNRLSLTCTAKILMKLANAYIARCYVFSRYLWQKSKTEKLINMIVQNRYFFIP